MGIYAGRILKGEKWLGGVEPGSLSRLESVCTTILEMLRMAQSETKHFDVSLALTVAMLKLAVLI
jgi:hypothetical protein